MRSVVKAKIIDGMTTEHQNETMQSFINECSYEGLIVDIKVADSNDSGLVVVVAYKELR